VKANVKITWVILALVLLVIVSAAYLWQTGSWSQRAVRRVGPLEKITLGTNLNEMLGLLFIAEDRGYFQDQGLEVVLKEYQTGLEPLKDLQEGRLDLASCAEFALAGEVLARKADQLRCLAVISSGEVDMLIARRDKGINRPEDLAGKTIGVPRKTSADFFLGRFLTLNQVALKEVTIIDVRPPYLADALTEGQVDAVLIWAPVTKAIINRVGHNAIVWPAQEGQSIYRLLVTREKVIQARAKALERLLRALTRAADYMKQHPVAGRTVIAQRLKVSIADLQSGKFSINYDLFLEQGLLLAMEDQARWMIKHRLTDETQVPNYLTYLDAEPLAKVNPKTVRLKIPGR